MFDFDNDSTLDKGLFTFYRQQAQIDQKIKAQKKKQKQDIQNFTLKQMAKLSNNQVNGRKFDNRKSSQTELNKTQKFIKKKSFDQMNRDLIRNLSLKNQTSFDVTGKQFNSEVIVIKKTKSLKRSEDLKLQKLNLRYQMQEGYFLKQKVFDPASDGLFYTNQNTQRSERSIEQSISKKRRMKRNQSLSDKYHATKIELQNELIISKDIKQKKQGFITPRLQGIRKIDVQPQFTQQEQRINVIQINHSNHLVHKRIPPKVLASIMKNENHELIKHLRKQLEKQRQVENKSAMQNKNHSFIEYGSHDYEKSGLDVGRLNQKQRRLITILNKFNKKPFTKIFMN